MKLNKEQVEAKVRQLIEEAQPDAYCIGLSFRADDGEDFNRYFKGKGSPGEMIRLSHHLQAQVMGEAREWNIWSNEHMGWWAPHEMGYVISRKDAGLYTFDRACEIIKGANIATDRDPNYPPNETMVLAI